jgi:hypothetical protein
MLNHAARGYLPAFEEHLRASVLGRAAGGKARSLMTSGGHNEMSEESEIRSPATDRLMRSFLDAWRTGDKGEQEKLLDQVAKSWRADNAMSGVPVHAHLPLPGAFAATVAKLLQIGAKETVESDFGKTLDPSLGMLIERQLAALKEKDSDERHLLRRSFAEDRDPVDGLQSPQQENGAGANALARRVMELFRNERSAYDRVEGDGSAGDLDHADLRRRVPEEVDAPAGLNANGPVRTMEYVEERDGRSGVRRLPWDGEQGQLLELQGYPGAPPRRDDPPAPIVKRARRYTTPGLSPAQMAQEDADAEALAREADKWIRKLLEAVDRNRDFLNDQSPLVRQFLQQLARYFRNGGRAVAPVGGDRRQETIHNEKDLAAYDPRLDRIVFTKRFAGTDVSDDDRMLTLIHELLHATPIIKQLERERGYQRDRRGGKVFSEVEVIVDNLAIRLAKRLGLISRNYPERKPDYYLNK